jgi:hypothetical protein
MDTMSLGIHNIMVENPMMYYDHMNHHPESSLQQQEQQHQSLRPSELIVSPYILLRLLEPLQRTVEIAFIVRSCHNHNNNNNTDDDYTNNDDEDDVTIGTRNVLRHGSSDTNNNNVGSVSVSSFHHSDTAVIPDGNSTNSSNNNNTMINNNAILQATTASLLKTETACTSNEFIKFDFITKRRQQHSQTSRSTSNYNIPDNVNDEVILVFPIKEMKAMLHFCSTTSSPAIQQQQHIIDPLVHVSFHWGGKPIMIQSSIPTIPPPATTTTCNDNNHQSVHANTSPTLSIPTYNMQLILATLDYRLLTSMRTIMNATTTTTTKTSK